MVAGELGDVVGPDEDEVVPVARVLVQRQSTEVRDGQVRQLVGVKLGSREHEGVVQPDLAARRVNNVAIVWTVGAVLLSEEARRFGRTPRERELVDQR